MAPPPGSHVLHVYRPWAGLQSVIVAFPDHTCLFFYYNGKHENILSKTIKSIQSLGILYLASSSRPLLMSLKLWPYG